MESPQIENYNKYQLTASPVTVFNESRIHDVLYALLLVVLSGPRMDVPEAGDARAGGFSIQG